MELLPLTDRLQKRFRKTVSSDCDVTNRNCYQGGHSLMQRFSIHFEARTPSGRKNHFCTPCTISCIVFCMIREVRTPRSPFSHPLGVRAPPIENHCLNTIYFVTMRLPFNATCGDVASWHNAQTD